MSPLLGLLCACGALALASGTTGAWQAEVEPSCGAPEAGEAASYRGSLSLRLPYLCSSYGCRSAILGSSASLRPAEAFALQADLLDCVLPQVSGDFSLLNISVSGLAAFPNSPWASWMSTALELVGADMSDSRAVWFPMGAGTIFYASVRGKLNATRGSLTAALQTASNEKSLFITGLKSSPVDFQESSGEMASGQLWQLRFAIFALALYAILAVVAWLGPPFLKPIFLCWPEVCRGQGCLLYRPLCCPLVLTYHFIRIYILDYLSASLGRCCFTQRTKGCCWFEFTDTEFPRTNNSIGKVQGDAASGVMYEGGVAWARASDIARAAAQSTGASPKARDGAERQRAGCHLFEGKIEPADVLQGALGDCWLMAAFATLAERPEVLQQAFVTKHFDPRGKYTFRLWNQIKDKPGTKWVDIVVDEYIPVFPNTLKPKFAKTHCNEIWVLLLEKAFAKMYGSYAALDGGHAHWALTAVTGNPSITLMRDGSKGEEWQAFHDGGDGCIYSSHENFDDHSMFLLLHKARRQGAFINCSGIKPQASWHGGVLGTPTGGLIDGHAYSVLRLATVASGPMSTSYFRLVHIRNPHGQGEWQGTWGDKSTAWDDYPHVQRELYANTPRRDDGSFWMQWEDFIVFWKTIEIVDCGTSIRSLAPPPYDSQTAKGTCLGCLRGSLEYWLCCLGMQRLYFGRSRATDVASLKTEANSSCGVDQSGFYCDLCERGQVEAEDKSSERGPLLKS